MQVFEQIFQQKYFPGIKFSDERERQVFLSYIKGFMLLILDSKVNKILEIGGGQSTALLATLGDCLGWELFTIDMNPDAIALKIRSQSMSDAILKKIHFRKGVSIPTNQIGDYYASELSMIGSIGFADVVRHSRNFIDTTMDARRAPKVAEALELVDFSADDVIEEIVRSNRLTQKLLDVFKSPGNEFEYQDKGNESLQACLQDVMKSESIDAVFLDSGEFSSLPEWDIVEKSLRPGGYVILHDIFFPKSFKNWLVCGAIMANSSYETLYIDRSTPQGLMVAQKKY
jgi:predicted O-methyltransferase YrrM